jgi:hypothetical protein
VDFLVGGVEAWWLAGAAEDGEPARREGGRRPTVDCLVSDMEARRWWIGVATDGGPTWREGGRRSMLDSEWWCGDAEVVDRGRLWWIGKADG